MRAIAPWTAPAAALLLAACTDPTALGVAAGTHPVNGAVVANLPLAFRPFGVAVSRSDVLYVTQLDHAAVTFGSTVTDTLSGSIGVGNTPTAVAFDPAGATAYVTNQLSSTVGVVDVASHTQVAQVPVSGNTFAVLVSADGGTVYATTNTNRLYAISAASRTATDSVIVGQAPNGLAMAAGDTMLYVSNFLDGTVSAVSLRGPLALARTYTPGGSPQGIVVSPNRSTLYVANENGALDVINIATGDTTTPVNFGAGAFGLAMTPDGTQLYATLPSVGEVAVVDVATFTVTRYIPAGSDPRRVAFSPDGLTAVVANQSGSVVFIR